MAVENIDYDALKRRGFLRQKQEGFFVLRARKAFGVYTNADLDQLARISQRYGRGFLHATTRQGLEIPYIKFGDIEAVEKEIKQANIEAGASGPRLRTTTCCPGNNWCKSGLVNTFSLYERIEKELQIRCALDLPHKFKIAISGCPNTCTRPQAAEIGIHGEMDLAAKRIGYAVYLGGCGGRTPRAGFKIDRVFTEDEVLALIEKVVRYFKSRAKPRQRLALLIEEVGKQEFLSAIGLTVE
ncbi:MAG: hypothetical protein Q8N85_06250 [Candidatus Omnitrophota bacterium]|nr:hypothetical protein [Candidatus Omnitrophota bacterium]